jgi:hypothetical protein
MRSWLLAVGLLAAAAVSPAQAADIDGVPPPPRSGPYGAYDDDDSRYPPKAQPPSYYDEDDDNDNGPNGPPPRGNRYGYTPQYTPQYTPPPRYAAPPPPSKYAGSPPGRSCVRSEHVRDRLTSEGWADFHDGKPVNDGLVTLRARRSNGRLFELTLHRCSGELVEVRPLQLRPFGPYAYRQPDGAYGRWQWGPQTAPYGYEDDDGREERFADRGPRRWHNND